MRADVNIIDFDNLNVRLPEIANDLPAGGARLQQRADGYQMTLVKGEPIYIEGQATDAARAAGAKTRSKREWSCPTWLVARYHISSPRSDHCPSWAYGGTALADWGADVIKIEPPPRKDAQGNSVTGGRRGPDEQNLHRNKRSLAIDLKHSEGRALFHRLARRRRGCGNFRSSVKYRLGVDYETLKGINPAIVYASIVSVRTA